MSINCRVNFGEPLVPSGLHLSHLLSETTGLVLFILLVVRHVVTKHSVPGPEGTVSKRVDTVLDLRVLTVKCV